MLRIQFTLRELFQATTLIAVGVWGISSADRWYFDLGIARVTLICLASAAAIGAGVGTPFHKTRAGAVNQRMLPGGSS